jgi:hypothetical protein
LSQSPLATREKDSNLFGAGNALNHALSKVGMQDPIPGCVLIALAIGANRTRKIGTDDRLVFFPAACPTYWGGLAKASDRSLGSGWVVPVSALALFALDACLSIGDNRHDDMPDLSASSALCEDIGSHAHVIFSFGSFGCSGCFVRLAISLGVIQSRLTDTDDTGSARDEVEF